MFKPRVFAGLLGKSAKTTDWRRFTVRARGEASLAQGAMATKCAHRSPATQAPCCRNLPRTGALERAGGAMRHLRHPRFNRDRKQTAMPDKDRIKGAGNQAKGAIKKGIGNLTGDSKLKAEGEADTLKGKVQSAIGGAKDSVRDAVKKD